MSVYIKIDDLHVVCFDPGGKWHGWKFWQHPDGNLVSIEKLEEVSPPKAPFDLPAPQPDSVSHDGESPAQSSVAATALSRDSVSGRGQPSPAPQPDAAPADTVSMPKSTYLYLRGALSMLPEDALGFGNYADPQHGQPAQYPILRELQDRVDQLLPSTASPLPADDIVARLRLHQIEEGKSFFALWDEAANEIERLRASSLPADDVVERIRRILNSRMNGAPNVNSFKVEETISELTAANLLRQSAPIEKVRQYYYRVDKCKAEHPDNPDCICWHDEGTGPIADAADASNAWRDKPASPPADVAGIDKAIEAVIHLARYRLDRPLDRSESTEVVRAVLRAIPISEPKTDAAGLREKIIAAIRHACEDEYNGLKNGCIIYKGCVAAEYTDPADAADGFIDGIADAILALLPSDAAVKALVERLKATTTLMERSFRETVDSDEVFREIKRNRATLAANGVKP